jgi:hypothetical protein
MKLIFIHGPPAAGKLTVATQLAKQTGYRLFHNHYSHDLVESLFEFGTQEFFSFCEHLRLSAFENAAKAGLPGLIFTFAYTNPGDDAFIRSVQALALRHQIDLLFVKLSPSLEALEKRIVEPNRKRYNKAETVRGLHKLLKMYDYSHAPEWGGLVLDNSEIPPDEAARRIMDHFGIAPLNTP